MIETKNRTKNLPVMEPKVDLGNQLDLPNWNSNWTVNKAVVVYNQTMNYTFLACMKVCEIIYRAKTEWKGRNVIEYVDDKGEKKKTNDYILFIDAIGINEKKAERMSKVFEEYAIKQGLLYEVSKEVKELPSSYTLLYEIATAEEQYEDNIKTLLLEKGAEISQKEIRESKRGDNGNDKVNGSFKPPEKSHLLAMFYITEEEFEKKEPIIKELISALKEQVGEAGSNVKDFRKEKIVAEKKKEESELARIKKSITAYVNKNHKVHSIEKLPEDRKVKKNGEEVIQKGLKTKVKENRLESFFKKQVEMRDAKLKRAKEQVDKRKKEIEKMTLENI